MSALAVQSGELVLDRPFTRAEANAGGLTDRDLRSDRFVRVFRGVYIDRAITRTAVIRAQAALRIAPPSAVVSHHTAAVMWGGAVPPQSVVHISVPTGQDCQVNGIRTHRYLDMSPPSWCRGLRVTSPERTICDLARTLDLVELVVLGDRLVRREVTTPGERSSRASTRHADNSARDDCGAGNPTCPPKGHHVRVSGRWAGGGRRR